MEDVEFDALTRRLGAGSGRRRVVGSLVAGLGGLLGLATVGPGAAKRKQHKRSRKASKAKGRRATNEAKGSGGGKPQGRCQTGKTNCRGTCVDIKTNLGHCGACATACSAGQDCCNGACVPSCTGGAIRDAACICQPPPPPTCGPDNCSGCCDGTTCRDGETSNFCGRGGLSCRGCNSLQVCAGGFCSCQRECCQNFDCEPAGASRCISFGANAGTCEPCFGDRTSPGASCPGFDGTAVPCCSGSCVSAGGVAWCGGCVPFGQDPTAFGGCDGCCSDVCDAGGTLCG